MKSSKVCMINQHLERIHTHRGKTCKLYAVKPKKTFLQGNRATNCCSQLTLHFLTADNRQNIEILSKILIRNQEVYIRKVQNNEGVK